MRRPRHDRGCYRPGAQSIHHLIAAAADENQEKENLPHDDERTDSHGRERRAATAGPHRQRQPADEGRNQRERDSSGPGNRVHRLRNLPRPSGQGARDRVVLVVLGMCQDAGCIGLTNAFRASAGTGPYSETRIGSKKKTVPTANTATSARARPASAIASAYRRFPPMASPFGSEPVPAATPPS